MRFVVHLVALYGRFGSRVEIDCKGNKEVFRKKGGVEMRCYTEERENKWNRDAVKGRKRLKKRA